MHLYIGVRGLERNVDKFMADLGAQYLPFKHKLHATKDNPEGFCKVELAVRPIRFYELVFPAEQLDTVIATTRCWGMSNFKQDLLMTPLRSALGCEKMPEMNREKIQSIKKLARPIFNVDIDCIGIGIKKDIDLIAENDIHEQLNGNIIVKKGEKISERL